MLFFVVLFWFSLALLVWSFIGYPLSCVVLSLVFANYWRKDSFSGKVSMIVAAHDEQEVIKDKVANCLDLSFGLAESEIIIVSDGSTDDTNRILEQFQQKSERLNIITYQPRAGKANAINVGVERAKGEILIFSDANVVIEKNSCKALLAPFADQNVGAVCGRVLVRPRVGAEVAGESLYMRLESRIQRSEALLWSVIGVDGAFFAIRKDIFHPLNRETILDDFALSMQAPAHGQRIVYEREAEAVEEVMPSVKNEFKRKARIVAGGYQYLLEISKKKFRFNFFIWYSLISHKVLRWIAPFLLFFLFISNLILANISIEYRLFLILQILFYFSAFLSHKYINLRRKYLFYIPYYFCMVNLAAFIGFIRFLTGVSQVTWEKAKRR